MDDSPTPPIRFDTKVAVLLRDDLATWQRLNVCAFLISGVASANLDIIGEPYADADDTAYLPMFRQPVLVFQGDAQLLTTAHERALSGNDRDNRAAVRGVPRDKLDLVGIALHGPKNAVDKVLKGAVMHP